MSRTKKKYVHTPEWKYLYAIIVTLILGIVFCLYVILAEHSANAPASKAATLSHVVESNGNIVINTVGAPADLVKTIATEDSGCDGVTPVGINTVYIERNTDSVAKVRYGCGLDASMYYVKSNGVWKSISPTNKFFNGVPLCEEVVKWHIPVSIDRSCYNESPTGQPPILAQNPNGSL